MGQHQPFTVGVVPVHIHRSQQLPCIIHHRHIQIHLGTLGNILLPGLLTILSRQGLPHQISYIAVRLQHIAVFVSDCAFLRIEIQNLCPVIQCYIGTIDLQRISFGQHPFSACCDLNGLIAIAKGNGIALLPCVIGLAIHLVLIQSACTQLNSVHILGHLYYFFRIQGAALLRAAAIQGNTGQACGFLGILLGETVACLLSGNAPRSDRHSLVNDNGLGIKLLLPIVDLVPDLLSGIARQSQLCAKGHRPLWLRKGNMIFRIGERLQAHIAQSHQNLGVIARCSFIVLCTLDHVKSLLIVLIVGGVIELLHISIRPGLSVRADKGLAVIRVGFQPSLYNGGHLTGLPGTVLGSDQSLCGNRIRVHRVGELHHNGILFSLGNRNRLRQINGMIAAVQLRAAGYSACCTGGGIRRILQIRIHRDLILRAVVSGVEGSRTNLCIRLRRQNRGQIGGLGGHIAWCNGCQPAKSVMGLLALIVVVCLCNGHHIVVGRLILIGDPDIAILCAARTPAVLDKPCTIVFRLCMFREILLGIVVIPADQKDNVVAPGIVRRVISLCFRIVVIVTGIECERNAVPIHKHCLQILIGTGHLATVIVQITVVDVCILHMVCSLCPECQLLLITEGADLVILIGQDFLAHRSEPSGQRIQPGNGPSSLIKNV